MGVVWLGAVAVPFATAVLRRARSASPTQLVRGLEAAQNAVADAPGPTAIDLPAVLAP